MESSVEPVFLTKEDLQNMIMPLAMRFLKLCPDCTEPGPVGVCSFCSERGLVERGTHLNPKTLEFSASGLPFWFSVDGANSHQAMAFIYENLPLIGVVQQIRVLWANCGRECLTFIIGTEAILLVEGFDIGRDCPTARALAGLFAYLDWPQPPMDQFTGPKGSEGDECWQLACGGKVTVHNVF